MGRESVRRQREALAVRKMQPRGKDPRPPLLRDDMSTILSDLDPSKPFDCAVGGPAGPGWAAFARQAVITQRSQSSFDPAVHAKRSDIFTEETVRDGVAIRVMAIRLPWDKMNGFEGSTLRLWDVKGANGFSAEALMRRHLEVNDGPANTSLFAYRGTKPGDPPFRHLTRDALCNEALAKAGRPPIDGHSFRIGGATSMLLANVDPLVVQHHGRWKAPESCQRYWRIILGILAARPLAVPVVSRATMRPFSLGAGQA